MWRPIDSCTLLGGVLGFAELFTPDADFNVTDYMGAESGRIRGRDRIVETVSTVLAKARTVHQSRGPG